MWQKTLFIHCLPLISQLHPVLKKEFIHIDTSGRKEF